MLASCGRPLASLCVNDLFWRRTDGVLCLLAWHSLYYALWHVGYYAYVTCHLAYCTLCLTYCATGPGESDCQFFLKTGNCKFGDGCKFNHPRDKVAAADEHPAREGMPDCSFYTKTGSCKFGASCKFNHPRSSGGQRAGSFSNNYDSQSAYH